MAIGIAVDKVCHLILKARQFDVKEAASDPDSGSNPSDDGEADVLDDTNRDAARQEIVAFIRAMNVDEQTGLVALAWVGRGTYTAAEWDEAVQTARSEHNARTAEYLLSLPLLGDYLADGLAAFGESCAAFDAQV